MAGAVPNDDPADTTVVDDEKLKPPDCVVAAVAGVENKPLAGAALDCAPNEEPNSPTVGAAEETAGEATLPKLKPVDGVCAPNAGTEDC